MVSGGLCHSTIVKIDNDAMRQVAWRDIPNDHHLPLVEVVIIDEAFNHMRKVKSG